jgi:hypothetical protein
MREAAYEALAILRHEADDQMAHSQYCHFLSWAEEGVEAMILPIGGHDCMWCFTDEVKLTCALVQDPDEAIKEVKLLGEHEEEPSQKIIELEALWKKLREDTQRLEEEKVTLEGMVKSSDELLMEIARETGLDHMREDEDDEEEEDDGGDAIAPPTTTPPPPVPPSTAPKEINKEGPVEVIPEQESPVLHEVIPQMLSPRCHSSVSTMHSWGTMRRICSGWRMTLMIWATTRVKTALTWMSSFPMMEVMIGIESLSLSLKIRIKNKFLGFA